MIYGHCTLDTYRILSISTVFWQYLYKRIIQYLTMFLKVSTIQFSKNNFFGKLKSTWSKLETFQTKIILV